MGQRNLPRRTFLKLAGAGAAVASAPRWAFAGPFGPADFPIPADKKLGAAWLKSLYARGAPRVYSGAALDHVAMPVGGIACGLVYLSGDGRLWHWDVFNENRFGVRAGEVDYAGARLNSGGGSAYVAPPAPESPFAFGFDLLVDGEAPRSMDRTGWSDVNFQGSYPIGTVSYSDPGSAIAAELEAFSPFIPLEADESSLPIAVCRFRLKNRGAAHLAGRLEARATNPVALKSGIKRFTKLAIRPIGGPAKGLQASAFEPAPAAESRPDRDVETWASATYEGWTAEGTAFGAGPMLKTEFPAYQGALGGPGERAVNSHATAPGASVEAKDGAVGTLTSRPFKLERRFLNFWIGGGDHPGKTCLNVLCDGRVVASATGADAEAMRQAAFDLGDFVGRDVVLQIVDAETGPWGHVNVGPIAQGDFPAGRAGFSKLPDWGTFAIGVEGADSAAAQAEAPFGEPQPFAVGAPFSLAPGASLELTFYVAWHFPNVRLGLPDDPSGRHYAARFADAAAVVRHVAEHPKLLERTRLWTRTWYERSTLPHWFLDRAMANTSTLATTTCHRFASGRFYAWEGIGCCAGTCCHVWQYAQAVGRLFPALERDTRERVDLGLGFDPKTGGIGNRAEYDRGPSVDGQAGRILCILREHQMSPDDAFLRRNWPKIKQAIGYLVRMDGNGDGILEGPQANTLDADWFGRIPWLSSMYLAALRAGATLAVRMDEPDFAAKCDAIVAAAQPEFEKLFNGEYYFQTRDPARFGAIGAYDCCHIDQVLGQSWAWQVGLPRVLPRERTLAALGALWKYNFAPDVGPWRAANKAGRWYAVAGDAGLVMTTNPRGETNPFGDAKAWQVGYFNECMSGFEHQVAAHMIAEGMVEQGLATFRAIHDRYDGDRRNPYNEIECSDHYARAMASYGAFVALTGFECDGPAGRLAFAPRLDGAPIEFAWVGAEGWGTYRQTGAAVELEVAHGRLRLAHLVSGLAASAAPDARVGRNGRVVHEDGRLAARFEPAITLLEGETLRLG